MELLDKYTMDSEAAIFYKEAILLLKENNIPFLMGGGMAVVHYTQMERVSKDLDILFS